MAEAIMAKDTLTADDISNFIEYYDQEDNDLEYDDYDQMIMKVTKMNNFELWEMLYNHIEVDIFACLIHGVKYANYELFVNILWRLKHQNSYRWIDYNELCEWASQNPDIRVYQFIQRLEPMIRSTNIFDRSFVINNELAISCIYINRASGSRTKRART